MAHVRYIILSVALSPSLIYEYFYLFSDIYHGIVSEFWQFSEKFWIEVVLQKNTEPKISMTTEQQNGGKKI